jgi:hypothetical protein
MRRVFSTDPLTGIQRFWNHNPADDTAYLETEQELTDSLDLNKAHYNDSESNWNGDMHRVASIPLAVVSDLMRRGIWGDEARMKAWLNDPDNRAFRTRPGRV